jgi:hypothetical protein
MLVVMASVFAVADMSAQTGTWAPLNDKTAAALVDMERKWAEADCTREPVAATLLADDFEGTTPEGRRFDKAQAIADAASAPPTRDCRLGKVDVRLFGDAVAITYGTSSSVVQGSDGPAPRQCLAWTDSWLKRNGAWRIVAAHDTPIDCK